MKVWELIEELQGMPEDAYVRVFNRASGGDHEIETATTDDGQYSNAWLEINTLGEYDA